jgi:hypothetical protein
MEITYNNYIKIKSTIEELLINNKITELITTLNKIIETKIRESNAVILDILEELIVEKKHINQIIEVNKILNYKKIEKLLAPYIISEIEMDIF